MCLSALNVECMQHINKMVSYIRTIGPSEKYQIDLMDIETELNMNKFKYIFQNMLGQY